MAVKANRQQEILLVKKCCPDIGRISFAINCFTIILVTLLISGNKIHKNIVDCRVVNHQQDSSNSNNNAKHTTTDNSNNNIDYSDYNDNKKNIYKDIYFGPDMMVPRQNNRDVVSDETALSSNRNNDANNFGTMLRTAASQPSFLDKDQQQAIGNDHELPPDYYYYYRLQPKSQQPNYGGSMDNIDGGRSALLNTNNGHASNNNNYNNNINNNQQYQRSKSINTYDDINTLVYPNSNQGNYDLEKRPDLGTTMSTLESYLPRSAPLRTKLLEMISQDMAVASNGLQLSKRGRGSSSCNFNSGLTSKCDNMDYLQAWNHHNWFHKTTLPG